MNPEIVKQMEEDYKYLSVRLRKLAFNEAEGIAMAGIARALATHYIIKQAEGEVL